MATKIQKCKTMQHVSEYEQLRNKNLEDNKAILDKLMTDLKEGMPGVLPVFAPPRKPRTPKQRDVEEGPIRRNPSRGARYTPTSSSPPRTRSRRGSVSSSISSSSSSPTTSPNKLVIRFGFFKKGEKMDSDSESRDSGLEDDNDFIIKAGSRIPRVQREIKSAEEVTQEDLDLVATFVSQKSYDSIYGSSCHQCRQKTDDMKTMCRSGRCLGVRGQFCGPCLRNRYGEDAKEALKNPIWMCPPCRGICNCSFCRKKSGKSCTGIMIHSAREAGFQSVDAYLQSFRK